MYHDWMRRWITELPQEVKRTYMIATLLHPCFKTYDFIEGCALIPATDKVLALGELRIEWATVWKPRSTSTATTPAEGETIDLDLG